MVRVRDISDIILLEVSQGTCMKNCQILLINCEIMSIYFILMNLFYNKACLVLQFREN